MPKTIRLNNLYTVVLSDIRRLSVLTARRPGTCYAAERVTFVLSGLLAPHYSDADLFSLNCSAHTNRMNQSELMYSHSAVTIALILFFVMMLSNETGFWVGRFVQKHTDSEQKTLTSSIQVSVLGLLALMLSFTFSMSMQRFDNRSMALVDEVNAVETTLSRVELLPEQYQKPVKTLINKYVDLRVKMGQVAIVEDSQRRNYNREISALRQRLWALTVRATDDDPRAVTTGAFVQSLNAVVAAQGKYNALHDMHVPEPVLFLLFFVLLASGGMMGYSGGLSGKRVIAPVVLVALLVTLIVYVILDLDRPTRGFIHVNQAPMLELQAHLLE